MKRISLIISIVSICIISIAQNAQNNEDEIFPSLPASPSPKAYEMAKYTEFPISDNFGVVPINIPIFSIKEKDISHPVELQYHTGGVKVAEEATWVGLGWSLKAGGVITRSVRDLPDDEIAIYDVKRNPRYGVVNETETYEEYGWLHRPDLIENFPELNGLSNYKEVLYDDWENSDINSDVNTGVALHTLRESNGVLNSQPTNIRFDCEPDIFYLSVNNINLKFIFDFEGEVKLINSNQKVEITPIKETVNEKIRINKFIVTDQKGFNYYFGNNFKEETTVSSEFHTSVIPKVEANNIIQQILLNSVAFDVSTISKSFTTAWYLYKIESPYGNDIQFDYYQKSNLKMPIAANLLQTKKPELGQETFSLRNTWNNQRSINHSINTCYLKDIIFSNRTLHFTLSQRSDLENGYRLDKIELFNDDDLINECVFAYNYMNLTASFKEKRLMLEAITKDGNKPYKFSYNPGDLPAKDTYQQDLWGYYSTLSTGLIPQIYVYPDFAFENQYRCFPIPGQTNRIIPGSNRSVNDTDIMVGVLSKVEYPTKGFSKYIFEPNTYFDIASQSVISGGGIRIASIEKYDNQVNSEGDPVIQLKENYSYNKANGKSSGILINKLAFATPTNYTFDPSGSYKNALYEWECTGTDWPELKKYEFFTVRSSNNFFPLTSMDGYQVAYTNVTIQQEGNGKIKKEYYPPRNFSQNASEVNSSAINSFENIRDYGDEIFIPSNDTEIKFSGECKTTTEYVGGEYVDKTYMEYTGKNFVTYIIDEECTFFDQPEDFYCFEDVNYYGGNGYFYPDSYSHSTPVLSNHYVFNINKDAFTIKNINYGANYNIYFAGIFLDKSFNAGNFRDIAWGKVQKSGTNIFPFPPLSDKVDDELIYNKLKSELTYEEGKSAPIIEKYYDYDLYRIGTENERVFGIVSSSHYVVPVSLKATAWDAAGSNNSAAAYFYGNVHGNYSMPKAWSKYYYNVNSTALLTEVRTKENFNGNIVEKIEEFDYNNNFSIAEEKLVYNIGKDIIGTKYYYPQDLPLDIGTTSTVVNEMITRKINSSVLKEEVTKNASILISGSIYNYKLENNLIVPSDVQVANKAGIFETRWVYDKYDLDGNIVQAHKQDHNNISFIWSYNNNYPVVKIENIAYDDILKATIDEINGHTFTNSSTFSDIQTDVDYLKSQLAELTANLEFRVTYYTYSPLIGMTSQTDPAGKTTYYEYDDFGRLQYVRDHNGNIVNRYNYHYAGQQ